MVPFRRLWLAPDTEWMSDINPGDKAIIVGLSRVLFFILFMTLMICSANVVQGIWGKTPITIEQPSSAQSRLVMEIRELDNTYLGNEDRARLIEKLIEKYDPLLEDINRTMNTLTEEEILERLEERNADPAISTRIPKAMRGE